jgi:hypothetical protein
MERGVVKSVDGRGDRVISGFLADIVDCLHALEALGAETLRDVVVDGGLVDIPEVGELDGGVDKVLRDGTVLNLVHQRINDGMKT